MKEVKKYEKSALKILRIGDFVRRTDLGARAHPTLRVVKIAIVEVYIGFRP